MGRLDEAAKRKVVELREAGLSFRKIKAVLELENIKVSAQAIYLFLKEFNVRNGTNQKVGGNLTGVQASVQGMAASSLGNLSRTNSWRDRQLGNLMREASRVAGYSTSPDPPQQGGPSSDDRRTLPSAAAASSDGGSREEQKDAGHDNDEEDIRIVSVTSLAQRAGVQNQRANPNTGVGAMAGIFARRRLTFSPATTNPVLQARKRLLDKALLHRARIREGAPTPGQQMAPAPRRDQAWRSMVLPQTSSSIDLTTTRSQQVRRAVDGLPDASLARRGLQPRMGAPPPPRVGVRLPSPSAQLPPSPTAQQAPAVTTNPTIRIQHPAAANQQQQQQPQRREPSPSFHLGGALEALRQGLGDQMQSLGSEVRSLGLAVRMLAEQQGRLEREQAQQTQVQKQILSTLQLLATRLGPCVNTNAHAHAHAHAHTHAPTLSSAQPTLPAVSTFSQSNFGISTQSTFSQGGTLPLTDNSVGLESADGFSMPPGMCSAGMNGFGSPEGLQGHQAAVGHNTHLSPPYSSQAFTSHTPTEYTPSLVQSHAHMQSPILGQGHAHADAFAEGKHTDFSTGQVDGNLQNCSTSMSPLGLSSQDGQLNIIKVENV